MVMETPPSRGSSGRAEQTTRPASPKGSRSRHRTEHLPNRRASRLHGPDRDHVERGLVASVEAQRPIHFAVEERTDGGCAESERGSGEIDVLAIVASLDQRVAIGALVVLPAGALEEAGQDDDG